MIERVIFFDKELLALYNDPMLEIPSDCILYNSEFELCRLMIEYLLAFRLFTKSMEYRNRPTLCHLPSAIDLLVSRLKTPVLPHLHLDPEIVAEGKAFSDMLTESVIRRFSWIFMNKSLALSAAALVPGRPLSFNNFDLPENVEEQIFGCLLQELLILSKPSLGEVDVLQATLLEASLKVILSTLKNSPQVLMIT